MSLLSKKILPLCGLIETVDAVDQAGLASAIGTDDGVNLPGLNLKLHILQRFDSAETERHIVHMQLDRHEDPHWLC